MSRLIETVRLEDGKFQRLSYHQQRMDDALDHFFKGTTIHLANELKQINFPEKGLYRCRVIYDSLINKIEFEPYTIRTISSLKMVEVPSMSYPFKWEDRDKLMNAFDKREQCDDVLILKYGTVTDTSYSNILFKKEGEWITPSSCLLKGTMRQYLLDSGRIREEQISIKDLRGFEKFKLINALMGWDGEEIDISNIV
jgi:4-amino-4-deoxychorismate lyase